MRAAAGIALALALLACRQASDAQDTRSSQLMAEVGLLTSLPLAFNDDFKLDAPAHPALTRLKQSFTIKPVDGPEGLAANGLLLAVQPRALTAERLVALDRWVRAGGRMLLLADPRFVWDSGRPLGDKLRPPYEYPDTGLLKHWGLALQAPTDLGPLMYRVGGLEVETAAPGTLSSSGENCSIEQSGLIARCDLGKGRVTVIADADFVQVGVPGGLDGPTQNNLDALASELERLTGR